MRKWRKILLFIGPGRNRYLSGLAGTVLLMAALDVCLAPILDILISAAVGRRADLLFRGVILAAAAVVLACAAAPFLQFFYMTALRKGMSDIRTEAYRCMALGRVDDTMHSGEVISVLTNDLSLLEELLGDSLVRFLTQLCLAVFAIGLMAAYNWQITIAVVLAAWAGSAVNNLLARKAAAQAETMMEGTAGFLSRLSDMVAGFSVMKVFHLERRLLDRMDDVNKEIVDAASRNALLRSGMDLFNGLLRTCYVLMIFLAGISLTMKGLMSFGQLAAIIQLTGIITAFFLQFGQTVAGLQQSFSAAGRILPVLEREHESESVRLPGPSGIPDSRLAETSETGLAIDISGLCLDIGGKRILSELTLAVREKSLTALVGRSGSGKSTLLHFLLGLRDPCEGYAEVMGKPLSELTRETLRTRFAYVPQNAWLFDQDLMENIRAGQPGASDQQARDAAARAGAHDFILALPDGYNTRAGSGGDKLSGGQRQRVALARAILSEAPILLLDEPTAALDAESERTVLQTLQEISRTRTVLVSTHRPSVMRQADFVAVLESGRCIASGTPGTLQERWVPEAAREGAP